MIWPFIPRDEYLESLEWRNDVIQAFSAEQRISLLSAPRQTLTFDHALSPRQYQRARLMMINNASGLWTVPIWHEKQTVSVTATDTTITVDTTASDYRVGGLAIVWASDSSYETVTISNKTGSSLTVSALTATYTNALVMPAISCRAIGGLEVSRTVDDYVAASVEFVSQSATDLADGGLYGSYRSYPIIDDPAVVGGDSVSERIEWPQDLVDNGLASPYADTLRDRAQQRFHAGWYLTSQSSLWAVRQFLHSLYGKQKAFWVPSWSSGLDVQSNITSGGNTITILAVGLNSTLEAGDLMVQTATAQYYFQFTSVAPSGADEVLTLSAVAGVNINVADIRRACLLHHCRLAQSRIEIIHRNPGHASIMVECDEVPL